MTPALVDRPWRVWLPKPPEEPSPHAFPILATTAPVIASIALWAVTQSPFALIFAALGPIIAVASVGDSRVQSLRVRRRESLRFQRECESTSKAIAIEHGNERAWLFSRAKGARDVMSDHSVATWRGSLDSPLPIRIGLATVPSTIELQGDPGRALADQDVEARLQGLRAAAAMLQAAPVVVDARLGVGFVGPLALCLAAARSTLVQLIAALSPVVARIEIGGDIAEHWTWLKALPHAASVSGRKRIGGSRVVLASEGGRAVVAVAERIEDLPIDVGVVVRVGGEAEVLRHPDPALRGAIALEFVSLEEAEAWALREAYRAKAEGFGSESGLPASVQLGTLLSDAGALGLSAALGVTEDGPIVVDLVSSGPHAVVAGMTGSGKSELLVSWVLALAAARSPAVVTFLLVDYKGGAAFEPLRSLPHCVGLITDLNAGESVRALSSMRAEIRYRERLLAEAGARSVDDLPPGDPFPRLVVVVDEYAAMVEVHPELHGLFVDLSARGRSLGVHLVLCTQRVGGVLREGILANCAVRISLRVNNRADSSAVIGTDGAAAPLPRGRALIGVAGAPPVPLQVALASPADVSGVCRRWAGAVPRKPWCPPLPTRIPLASLGKLEPGDDVPFALVDLPHEQQQAVGRFDPGRHGHLLVVGAAGSGKSGVLAALGTAPSRAGALLVRTELAAVWDALSDALVHSGGARLLLLDDFDALAAACPEDYLAPLLDLLGRVLREGPARGIHVALTMQRVPGALQSVVSLCGSPLVLRMQSRHEHLMAGGEADEFVADLSPGGGHWRGNRVQVALARMPAPTGYPVAPMRLDLGEPDAMVAVSTRPAAFAERLRALRPSRPILELSSAAADPRKLQVSGGGESPILVGDPDTWQLHWGALGGLRASAGVIFDGCSASDFRMLSRLRTVPPPAPHGERALWLLDPEGRVVRARLVAGQETSLAEASAENAR